MTKLTIGFINFGWAAQLEPWNLALDDDSIQLIVSFDITTLNARDPKKSPRR